MNGTTSRTTPLGLPLDGSDISNDLAHCTHLRGVAEPGTEISSAMLSGRHLAQGTALDAGIQVLGLNEALEFAHGLLGEEVGAVLQGRIDIVAAQEHYVLSEGEAILIPPGEMRRFTCLTERCVLYRVTVRTDANQAEHK